MIGIIYKFTAPNGRCYIGQTANEYRRMHTHRHDSIRSNNLFSRAIRKYGFYNLKYEVLYRTIDCDDKIKIRRILNLMEIAYIEYFDSFKNGYNCTAGGGGINGSKHSEETKKQMSIDRTGSKNGFYGKKHSQLLKDRLSIARKGSGGSFYGKRHSDEIIAKLVKRCSKPVFQYNINMVLLKEWSSASEAMRGTNIDHSSISKCSRGELKSAGGFIWKYK